MPLTVEFVESTLQSSPVLIERLSASLPEPPLLKHNLSKFLSTLEQDVQKQANISLPLHFIKTHLSEAYLIAQVAILCHTHWDTELSEEKCAALKPFLSILEIARPFTEEYCSFSSILIETWNDFLALLNGTLNTVNKLYEKHGIEIYLPPNDPSHFLGRLQRFAPAHRIRDFATMRNDFYALIEAFSSGDADLMSFAMNALRSVDGPAGYACCFPQLMKRVAEMEEVDRHFMINNWVKALGLSQAREELLQASSAILSLSHRNIILATIDTIEHELEQIDRRDDVSASTVSQNRYSFSNQENYSAGGQSASPRTV